MSIVVKDPATRVALRDIYLRGWYEYLALASAGLVPWAPVTDREAEAAAIGNAGRFAAAGAAAPAFAETLDTAPALCSCWPTCARSPPSTATSPRYTLVGGASIYPFVWSLLLAARAEGLGGVMTSVAVRREDDVRALFDIPDTVAVAALVALGRPVAGPGSSTRAAGGVLHLGRPLRRRVRSAGHVGSDPAVVKWGMAQNVLGEDLEPCNYDPLTGFYRDGCCNTGAEDLGVHTVCTRVTAEFLAFSASVGNDLSTPHPEFGFAGLQPGDQWCLCARAGRRPSTPAWRPRSILASTHAATLEWVQLGDLVAHAI